MVTGKNGEVLHMNINRDMKAKFLDLDPVLPTLEKFISCLRMSARFFI